MAEPELMDAVVADLIAMCKRHKVTVRNGDDGRFYVHLDNNARPVIGTINSAYGSGASWVCFKSISGVTEK